MIDTHCHLTRVELASRLPEVLGAARAAGVHSLVSIATGCTNAIAARDLARANDGVSFSAGVHPLYAEEPIDWDLLREAAEDECCVAWGELGLDHHYPRPPRPRQREVLESQLGHIVDWESGAARKERGVVVHCRKSFDELVPILRASGIAGNRFVFHCFSGGRAEAEMVLEMGAWISFTGILTYANAPEVREAAAVVPLDRIMVETDSPYLSPEPDRRRWPNEPASVVAVAKRLAEIRGIPLKDLETLLDANAVRFFGPRLKGP